MILGKGGRDKKSKALFSVGTGKTEFPLKNITQMNKVVRREMHAAPRGYRFKVAADKIPLRLR
jgi:hypothetical protein